MKIMKVKKTQEPKITEDSEKKFKRNTVLISIAMFFLTVLLSLLDGFISDKDIVSIIKLGVFSSIGSLVLAFSFAISLLSGHFDYDNNEHPIRFFVFYCISLILSLAFPFMNVGGWAFLGIAVSLSIFSNSITGISGVAVLLMNCCLISNSNSYDAFFVYFAASLISILLFRNLDEHFMVGSSISVSLLSLFLFETCGFVFGENIELSFEQFIFPIANVAVSALVLFGVLKYFNETVANKYRNKYLELNDQEYSVLKDIKNISKDEYFRSIHTAYLVERMANAIGCDVLAAKNCAYYHRIKHVFNYNNKECENFTNVHQFPPKAKETLLTYLFKIEKPECKECCLVYISDNFISTLQKVFSKDSKININYDDLIDALFERDYFKSALEDSDLTNKDFKIIKEIMKKETLYYDFLR